MSVEITVSAITEDAADALLDSIVKAIRAASGRRGSTRRSRLHSHPVRASWSNWEGVRWSVSQRRTRRARHTRGINRRVRRGRRVSRAIWVPPGRVKTGRTGGGAFRPTGDLFFPLKRFQRRFMARVLSPGIRRAVLSLPRGNGKSWLAGHLAAESLRPGGALYRAGDENVLLSGSFDQARYVYRFAKGLLGEGAYVYADNKQRMEIRHKASGTRLMVKSSRARGAFGIVGAKIAIAGRTWRVGSGRRRADGRCARHGAGQA